METMRTTTDTYTGKRFRYNGTCAYTLRDGSKWIVPQRMTTRTCEWLHPGRTPDKLLAALNDGRTWTGERRTYDQDMADLEKREAARERVALPPIGPMARR
jgi:hypothetical protein